MTRNGDVWEIVRPAISSQIGTSSEPSQGVGARPGRVGFILSSVRSGSTLLRVMLAGNRYLFCPPELNLLGWETLRERGLQKGASTGPDGLEVALTRLLHVPADEALSIIADLSDVDVSTEDVLAILMRLAHPRVLVDKSPNNAARVSSMAQAERIAMDPRYVFLVRHPYSVIESILRNNFHKIMSQTAGRSFPDSPESSFRAAEGIWFKMNWNIVRFLAGIQGPRFGLIRYEELVANPNSALASICALLGVPHDPAALDLRSGDRMLEGPGDPNFGSHEAIVEELSDAWRRYVPPYALLNRSKILAKQLGYDVD